METADINMHGRCVMTVLGTHKTMPTNDPTNQNESIGTARRSPRPIFPKVLLATLALLVVLTPIANAEQRTVDTALVIAVDTSRSVDADRYRLQMEGIARALEDPEVLDAILGGYHGAILLTLVTWADRSSIRIPWTRIQSQHDAQTLAAKIRTLPYVGGEFTCLARMLHHLSQTILADLPAKPGRIVVDVSGDGIDNCGTHADSTQAKEALVRSGITINGLPIIIPGEPIVGAGAYRAPGNPMEHLPPPNNFEALTLDVWYRRNVIGGVGSFLMPANGYQDFERAMRHKFLIEISKQTK